ncbi:AcrR family transcriptional regulator [Rhodanobacter sp. K2T2]|uniref:hypothetical protein n=1 Tax=Rhodanobacter sp. K2T2 TaxID=2723085 RepID=UPI0015CC852A|nr:hypothetical protein [Rhodanobacter sp. K2T2]NYE29607.1 AcrR family transcriptional regulator [Rhodanobacter sp. K2T2]
MFVNRKDIGVSGADTRKRLCVPRAAESRFIQHGYEARSLHQIAPGANPNPVPINHHFAGNALLIEEMLAARLDSLNRERLRSCQGSFCCLLVGEGMDAWIAAIGAGEAADAAVLLARPDALISLTLTATLGATERVSLVRQVVEQASAAALAIDAPDVPPGNRRRRPSPKNESWGGRIRRESF